MGEWKPGEVEYIAQVYTASKEFKPSCIYSKFSLNIIDGFLETATLNDTLYNEPNFPTDGYKQMWSVHGIFLVTKISLNFYINTKNFCY